MFKKMWWASLSFSVVLVSYLSILLRNAALWSSVFLALLMCTTVVLHSPECPKNWVVWWVLGFKIFTLVVGLCVFEGRQTFGLGDIVISLFPCVLYVLLAPLQSIYLCRPSVSTLCLTLFLSLALFAGVRVAPFSKCWVPAVLVLYGVSFQCLQS